MKKRRKGGWGIWHVAEKCFLGNAKGPNNYTLQDARAAATIGTEMFKTAIRVKVLPPSLVDTGEIEAEITGEEAIKRIEARA